MKNGYALSQTAGAKLESAVNRNGLASTAGQIFEWMATGDNIKRVAEIAVRRPLQAEYWRSAALGEKIDGVLLFPCVDEGISNIDSVTHLDLQDSMDGYEIAKRYFGLESFHSADGFAKHAVNMNQVRELHIRQFIFRAPLVISKPRDTRWNVFPVFTGDHLNAVFIRYGEDGATTIKAGNYGDIRWDIGTRVFFSGRGQSL